ncbi:glycogen-binding domain-containing protein [Mucilaginibacter sp. UR6-1]|uniref:glycogen-binding domain-containing protein n=1 Tax=Mucilaginibacter sp. UR6-1 TaxID=1435643 RepID=UPI001E35C326|nr:glycogen-binding domain-containing protein [Mucilaginibacter sp. UR6-1]MCC8407474.1 glycogen-binding domain-containing protein [Mucilaginibacter sp. UR6-1]
MMFLRCLVIIILLLAGGLPMRAQQRNSLTLANDKLILQIDKRSAKNYLDTILTRAGVNGDNISTKILKGDYSALTSKGWQLAENSRFKVRFNRALNINFSAPVVQQPFIITTNTVNSEGSPGYPADVLYGVNKFGLQTVRELPNGMTRFFVPGNLTAKRVYVSGSFNMWSLSKGIMLKTDSGWITDVKLKPGIYAYKFIINGNWTHDVNNKLTEHDGFNHVNSIYYRYNYTFRFKGFQKSAKVFVAGSFNKWNTNEIPLTRNNNGWQASMYLHDGTFLYRFMLDGRWITDPANKSKANDEKGLIASVINLGEMVNFKLKGYTNANKVCIAGSFNNWQPERIFLKKTDNLWQLPVIIPQGNYGYKYIVDGKWITDPANTCYVNEGGETNSFIAVKPNYTFKLLGYLNAQSVRVAGSFNNWNPDQYTMGRKGDEWILNIKLPVGKTRYKFVVDGNWILDPGNKQWESNEFDTGNSVIWIDPETSTKTI